MDAQEQTFPFEAWDMIEHKAVIVVARYDAHMYRLKSGYLARIDSVTTAFPRWYIEAQQQLADARDEAETMEDVRYG